MSNPKYIDADEFWDRLISVSENDWVGFDTIDEVLSGMPAEPRWIPVTERLPDINDHYNSDVCLVYCDNGVYTFAVLKENIFGQVGWICEGEDDYPGAVGTVVAWMPLPEPYKSGEQR